MGDVALRVSAKCLHLLNLGSDFNGQTIELIRTGLLFKLLIVRLQISQNAANVTGRDLEVVFGPGGVTEQLASVFGRILAAALPVEDYGLTPGSRINTSTFA